METSYTCQYFINKFKAIPEENWCTDDFENRKGQHCAFGHCGLKDSDEIIGGINKQAIALFTLLQGTVDINDGLDDGYQQPTPKQRILAALYDIKASEDAVQQTQEILNTTIYENSN